MRAPALWKQQICRVSRALDKGHKTFDKVFAECNTRHITLSKQHIFRLEQGDGVIVGDEALKKYITTYYKNLFGQPEESSITMVENRIDDIPQVTEIENEILTSQFTEDEVKVAVF